MSHFVDYKGHMIYREITGEYYIDHGSGPRYKNFNDAKKVVDVIEAEQEENFVDIKTLKNDYQSKRTENNS